eukprot:Skav200050  [mRNA]  locus=scaffold337:556924:571791:- [translate_table: standard]
MTPSKIPVAGVTGDARTAVLRPFATHPIVLGILLPDPPDVAICLGTQGLRSIPWSIPAVGLSLRGPELQGSDVAGDVVDDRGTSTVDGFGLDAWDEATIPFDMISPQFFQWHGAGHPDSATSQEGLHRQTASGPQLLI